MDQATLINIFLGAGSVLLAAWLCLPELQVILRRRPIQNGFKGGSEEVTPYWLHNIDDDLYQQMISFGFKPVGVYWETIKFFRVFKEIVFANPANPGFGILEPNDQNGPRQAFFLTVFQDGAVVFTKNYQGGMEGTEEDFLAGAAGKAHSDSATNPQCCDQAGPGKLLFRVGVVIAAGFLSAVARETVSPGWIILGVGVVLVLPHLMFGKDTPPKEDATLDLDLRIPLQEVFQEHRRRVAEFTQAGHVPVPGFGADSFLEVQRLYHDHPLVRREFVSAERLILGAKLLYFGLVPVLVACYLGLSSPAPWACLLVEGLIMASVRYGLTSGGVLNLLRRLFGNPTLPDEGTAKRP